VIPFICSWLIYKEGALLKYIFYGQLLLKASLNVIEQGSIMSMGYYIVSMNFLLDLIVWYAMKLIVFVLVMVIVYTPLLHYFE
jgi:hypothetical protein